MTDARKEVSEMVFAQYSEVEGFFFTSDNQAFTKDHEQDAKNHAKTLSDKKIDWVERPTISSKIKKVIDSVKGAIDSPVDAPVDAPVE